jgi:hypothetical protein
MARTGRDPSQRPGTSEPAAPPQVRASRVSRLGGPPPIAGWAVSCFPTHASWCAPGAGGPLWPIFALIARHRGTGGQSSSGEGAYACERPQQYNAAARDEGRVRAVTQARAQLISYGRHRGAGLRRLRGTLKILPPTPRPGTRLHGCTRHDLQEIARRPCGPMDYFKDSTSRSEFSRQIAR